MATTFNSRRSKRHRDHQDNKLSRRYGTITQLLSLPKSTICTLTYIYNSGTSIIVKHIFLLFSLLFATVVVVSVWCEQWLCIIVVFFSCVYSVGWSIEVVTIQHIFFCGSVTRTNTRIRFTLHSAVQNVAVVLLGAYTRKRSGIFFINTLLWRQCLREAVSFRYLWAHQIRCYSNLTLSLLHSNIFHFNFSHRDHCSCVKTTRLISKLHKQQHFAHNSSIYFSILDKIWFECCVPLFSSPIHTRIALISTCNGHFIYWLIYNTSCG